MNCYETPKLYVIQHEGAPQIVANKQELDGVQGHRDATSFRIEHCVTDA